MSDTLYDHIGRTYTLTRQPDPRVAAAIMCGLGDADTVVNVGAGAGTFDVALAVLTLHHWTDWRRGLDEIRRVANRLVVFTVEPGEIGNFSQPFGGGQRHASTAPRFERRSICALPGQ
jgi:SAM-dependent methyltransferase